MALSIKKGLELNNYAVDICYDAESGLSYASDSAYDFILIDRRLPDGKDGLDICRQLRATGVNTPVVIITAYGEVVHKVEGLRAGADDYLVKPFSLDELYARIEAILRRPADFKSNIIKLDNLTLDSSKKEVKRADKVIDLSPKEYALLYYMLHNVDRVLSKDQLLAHLWNDESEVLASTVESYISSLRKKIDKSFVEEKSLIHTRWGFGYLISERKNV
jgi:DNA-binding response OmpR family regulator